MRQVIECRIVTLISALLLATPAVFSCTPSALDVEQVSGGRYDPADVRETPLTLRMVAADPAALKECDSRPWRLGSRTGSPHPPRPGRAGVRLQVNPGRGAAFLTHGSAVVLTDAARRTLVEGQAVTLELGRIRPGQFLPPGDYRQELTIAVGDNRRPITLAVAVEPAIRFAAGQKRHREISLGDPAEGVRATSDILYVTNANVRVTATSEHGGELQHERGGHLEGIPYRALLAGKPLRLGADRSDEILLSPGIDRGSRRVRLLVEVPPPGPRFAGVYRDVLQLSFTPY